MSCKLWYPKGFVVVHKRSKRLFEPKSFFSSRKLGGGRREGQIMYNFNLNPNDSVILKSMGVFPPWETQSFEKALVVGSSNKLSLNSKTMKPSYLFKIMDINSYEHNHPLKSHACIKWPNIDKNFNSIGINITAWKGQQLVVPEKQLL